MNVIQLKTTPNALQHDASELKSDPKRSPSANGSGFKRRF
jgi:hypothetical protein